MTEITEDGRLNLASQTNGSADAAARVARNNSLVGPKGPTTRASTGSWVQWNNMQTVLGQPFDMANIPLAKLEQMRRDPILAFGLMFCKVPLIRAHWKIECKDPRIAAAVQQALARVYARFILAYTNAFDYGFSPMVKRFELINPDWTYKDDDGVEQEVWPDDTVRMLVWKPFLALNPRQCEPAWTEAGEFNGIRYTPGRIMNGGGNYFGMSGYSVEGSTAPPDVPADRALWATNEKDSSFGSLWGYPRIGYAYRFWWSYWYDFALSDRAFEKWADPPVKVFHPAETGVDENGEVIDFGQEALNLAEKLRSGANVAMPSKIVDGLDGRTGTIRAWDAEQMEHKVDFSGHKDWFEYLDVQKLRSVMVPEQALIEGKGGTSSRNVAATFGDAFTESLAVVKAEIDDHLNRYVIPQFVEANFGAGYEAKIVTTGFDPQDVETIRAVVQGLANKDGGDGLPVDIGEVMEKIGIPSLKGKALADWAERRDAAAAVLNAPVADPNATVQPSFADEIEDQMADLADRISSVHRAVEVRDAEREIKLSEQQHAAASDIRQLIDEHDKEMKVHLSSLVEEALASIRAERKTKQVPVRDPETGLILEVKEVEDNE
jgi:hypothetical protein